MRGSCYSVSHVTSALSTNDHDLVSILASSDSKLEVCSVKVSLQTTDVANLPGPGIDIFRGSTGTWGSTTTLPAANKEGHTGQTTASFTANRSSSGLISTASSTRLFSGCMTGEGFEYEPDCKPIIDVSDRFFVRLRGNAGGLAARITVETKEIGKIPNS